MTVKLFRLAWRNVWRNRRRSLITLAAMSLSVMLVQGSHNLSVGVYAQMIDNGVRAGSGHLSVYVGDYARSRDEKLTFHRADLQTRIAALPGVAQVAPRLYLPGMAQSSRESRGILLTGVDPEVERVVNPFLRKLGADEMLRSIDGRDAVIGEKLLRELQLKPGQKFVVTVQGRDGELASELLRVRGVVRTGMRDIDGSLVLVGRERAAKILGVPDAIHELAVILVQAQDDVTVYPQVVALLGPHPGLRVVPWETAMVNLANAIKFDYASQQVIFIIILLIVTIGMVNTVLMSVLERMREFGVMRALGATSRVLVTLVLTEALLLGVVAALFGTLLGSGLTWYLAEVGIDLRDYIAAEIEFGGVVFEPIIRADWDWVWMGKLALWVIPLSVFAALYPALKAVRIAPVEAMRQV
ncbi:MAG: FtsX-like permease family protein [Desulfuromonadales bacterium]|nr:FtsX-like permease family protein [Desulfuromonadales bacterium]MDT8422692.1 FtsX-like permease family protein [Desulfuromonadales bacterium]